MLEDMIKVYVIDFGACRHQHFPLEELSYNYSYHSSIRMDPFEVFYKRYCRSLINCFDTIEMNSLDTKFLEMPLSNLDD